MNGLKRAMRLGLGLLAVMFFVVGCAARQSVISPTAQSTETAPTMEAVLEQSVMILPLEGVIAERRAELSGLAWHGDTLVLLPQFPEKFAGRAQGAVYGLERKEILAAIHGERPDGLTPFPIPIQMGRLKEETSGYEGFEAIAFEGDEVWLTVEAHGLINMRAVVVHGRWEAGPEIVLDAEKTATSAAQTGLPNLSDEAILVKGGKVLTFYEANGERVNKSSIAHVFDLDLQPLENIGMPHLDYRLTDATAVDEQGNFWVSNFYYPPERWLNNQNEPLAARFGRGASHQTHPQVERLVEMHLGETGIELIDTAPVQLVLEEEARNWEGLARLDGYGFLLVTDYYPKTLLGYVAYP